MRKFLKLLSTTLVIINSSIVVVGCRPPTLGEVWIITDGGDLFDKAFNQQVVEGSEDFAATFNDHREQISSLPGFEFWKNRSMRVKWIISKDGDLSTLQNNYNIATYAGAKTIICAGFHHIPALSPDVQKVYANLGVKFILIDSLVSNPINVAGITYAAEQSSYLAALAGAIWLVANHEDYQGTSLKMSSFGGTPTDVVVENMAGYYWGVTYFNALKGSDAEILAMINKLRAEKGREDITKEQLANFNITFDKLENSFSGGFESGTPAAKAITSQAINDRKNNIVFPVAGAQTTDLISTIVNSPNNNKAKIIGVDVDQSKQYPHAKDYFLTSALKGIHASVAWMLWNSLNLKYDKGTDQVTAFPDGEKYFNGEIDFAPLKDPEFTGISDNPAINAIYPMLINNPEKKYWNLAAQVYDAFKKLSDDLASNSDPKKWENAWKTAIDEQNDRYRPKWYPKE